MSVTSSAPGLGRALLLRNDRFRPVIARDAARLAAACRDMAARFLDGGRLLAFGRGPYATDAQHVSVEFVHPVIVGKRALPALDVSAGFGSFIAALAQPLDIVMGFGPPSGDHHVAEALADARRRGCLTFGFDGSPADFSFSSPVSDPFEHQELVEVLYHTLWESVHVFFEHRPRGHDAGAASFLYPFLGGGPQDVDAVLGTVAESIVAKAEDDADLRRLVAETASDAMTRAVDAIAARVAAGGAILVFGNGGSATDANDFAIDCVSPAAGERAIPALSLSTDPASITAIANDVGFETVFLRQVIAFSRPNDVAVAISTSGGSANVVAALAEARKRGLLTVALCGYDGGDIVKRGLADVAIVVPSDYIPRIQEVQASVYHCLIQALRC